MSLMEKEGSPGRARRRFTKEFKADAVALVLDGGSGADQGYGGRLMTTSCVKDGLTLGTEDGFSATHPAIALRPV
ncbi:MAG: hypothetical protein F4Y28_08690 [Acidimicrobiia bacterium]|nr:hypothetical protein [Acidimicrobiia bacterium]MYG59706.1 hypothetical protein [Acidimicrobiia bacterium]MYJ34143.1 hypothetical protein [Acidimicrobiia bacterium]